MFSHEIRMTQEGLAKRLLFASHTGKWPWGQPSAVWREYNFVFTWFPSWCRDSRTIKDCWTPWSIACIPLPAIIVTLQEHRRKCVLEKWLSAQYSESCWFAQKDYRKNQRSSYFFKSLVFVCLFVRIHTWITKRLNWRWRQSNAKKCKKRCCFQITLAD